jgi:hypothetical protein
MKPCGVDYRVDWVYLPLMKAVEAVNTIHQTSPNRHMPTCKSLAKLKIP